MGNPAGVRRDFDALEKRRLQAAQLLKRGVHEAEVARRVGVHRQSVNRWARQLEEQGIRGLKKVGRAGRKPRLTAPMFVGTLQHFKTKIRSSASVVVAVEIMSAEPIETTDVERSNERDAP